MSMRALSISIALFRRAMNCAPRLHVASTMPLQVVALGHSENLSLRDIQTNIEMDSHEEKLAIMIRQVDKRPCPYSPVDLSLA